MTVRELIDFYLALDRPGGLIGFRDLHADEIEALKEAIREHYGSQERWLCLDEDAELPEEIAARAESLLEKHRVWERERE